jgi:hypothetical protein
MDKLSRQSMGIIILILFLFPGVSCSMTQIPPTGTPEPTDTPAPTTGQVETNNLIQALSMLPTNVNHVYFTNWAYIKEYEGFTNITNASSDEEKWQFLMATAEHHAAPSFYSGDFFLEYVETWGWDTTDLDWEASMQISFGPAYVLKFRDDFDFTPVLNHFEERDFTPSIYQGVTIYTHKVNVKLEWQRQSGSFAILNTAVLMDEHLLVMSISSDDVHNMVDVYQKRSTSLADIPAVKSTTSSLGEVGAAFISADACSALNSDALLKVYPFPSIAEQLRDRPQIQRYSTLGIGYRYEGTQSVGFVVMHFSNNKIATIDLEPRRQLAVEGHVRASNSQTYSEVYFTLNKASVEGNQIIFEVAPVNNKPMLFFGIVSPMDMMFATCP